MNHTASPSEAFIEAAASLMELSQEVRQHLSDHLKVRHFDPRQLLLPKGHAFDGVFFIHSGRVRGLRDASNGQEASVWFLAEGDFIPPVYDKPDGRTAFKSVEMLEESPIVWLNRSDLDQLYDLFPETHPLENRISLLHLGRVTEFWESFQTHPNSKALYKWLLERFPQWADRVKGQHMASFLGISPQSLSRIQGSKSSKRNIQP